MTDPWRLLDLGVVNPHVSVAIMEVLFIARMRKLIPNTLLFCTPERNVAITGGSMKLLNLEYCRKEEIPIVREWWHASTAVIHDKDTLTYEIVSDPIIQGVPINRKLIMDSVIKGLQFLGLDASIRAKSNDILIKGKKVVGTISLVRRGVYVDCGSMLVDFDYNLCEGAIPSIPELFANKEAKSHSKWMTTLRAQLGREVSFSEVVSALRKGFEDVLQIEFDTSNSLTKTEKQILEELLVKYQSEEWLKTGRWSPVKDHWR